MIVNKPSESYSSRELRNIAYGALFYYDDDLHILTNQISECGRYICIKILCGSAIMIDPYEKILDNQIYKIKEITLDFRR